MMLSGDDEWNLDDNNKWWMDCDVFKQTQVEKIEKIPTVILLDDGDVTTSLDTTDTTITILPYSLKWVPRVNLTQQRI